MACYSDELPESGWHHAICTGYAQCEGQQCDLEIRQIMSQNHKNSVNNSNFEDIVGTWRIMYKIIPPGRSMCSRRESELYGRRTSLPSPLQLITTVRSRRSGRRQCKWRSQPMEIQCELCELDLEMHSHCVYTCHDWKDIVLMWFIAVPPFMWIDFEIYDSMRYNL